MVHIACSLSKGTTDLCSFELVTILATFVTLITTIGFFWLLLVFFFTLGCKYPLPLP